MWIPHFLFEFWEPETDQNSISASMADTQEREFEIQFYLENPPTRRQGVELRLDGPKNKLQTDGMGRQVKIRFEPKEGELNLVRFRLKDSIPKAAFVYCYDNLSRLMSVWAVATGSGYSIFGVRIIDRAHNARWKIIPQKVAPEEFFLPIGISMDDEHTAIFSLYREARNSQSPYYRFLCCYKILEAWYRGGGIFGVADKIVRKKSLGFRRPRRTVTTDMLVWALIFDSHPEFVGVSFKKLFTLLNPWRIKVAHAITDTGEFINFDVYESQTDIGPIANLTDLIAQQILQDEVDMWRQLVEAGVIRRP